MISRRPLSPYHSDLWVNHPTVHGDRVFTRALNSFTVACEVAQPFLNFNRL